MSQQRSQDQKRARVAWDNVLAVKQDKLCDETHYRQLARKSTADIQSNGLGPTLSFWNAKKGKDKHFGVLLGHVSLWTLKQLETQDADGLLHWVMHAANTDDYRRATTEALAFLQWVKRFAEAELKEK